MDQIEINGLRVMARHGYTKEEKMMEQEFEIDTILYCSLEKAIETDKVEHTVECGELIKLITQTLKRGALSIDRKSRTKVNRSNFDYSPIICGVELALKRHKAVSWQILIL